MRRLLPFVGLMLLAAVLQGQDLLSTGAPPVNGAAITPTTVTATTVNSETGNFVFVDAGTAYVHGPITFDSTITGCRINPSVDSNFLYFQNCAIRSAAAARFDGALTSSSSIQLTDDATYVTIVDHKTKPTVTACSGGTAASVTAAAGTATVIFDVGTACAGESTAVLTFPASTTGWLCSCSSTTADRVLQQKVIPPASTTQVTIQNIVMSTGANGDFADGADVACICRGI